MKKSIIILCILTVCTAFSQKDSLAIGDFYLEDQFYLGISYNSLSKLPATIESSSFSYGFSVGYFRDIPVVKSGKLALALGLGYRYELYNNDLRVSANQITKAVDAVTNKMYVHHLDIPFEFRWRSSTSKTYKFWRVYTGFKVSYAFKNTFAFSSVTANETITNSALFKKLLYGLTTSIGYDAFNVHVYYGLNPIFDGSLNGVKINTKTFNFGLIFYIL